MFIHTNHRAVCLRHLSFLSSEHICQLRIISYGREMRGAPWRMKTDQTHHRLKWRSIRGVRVGSDISATRPVGLHYIPDPTRAYG